MSPMHGRSPERGNKRRLKKTPIDVIREAMTNVFGSGAQVININAVNEHLTPPAWMSDSAAFRNMSCLEQIGESEKGVQDLFRIIVNILTGQVIYYKPSGPYVTQEVPEIPEICDGCSVFPKCRIRERLLDLHPPREIEI
jgi:hypothetical protein